MLVHLFLPVYYWQRTVALWRYLQAVTLNTNLGSIKIELFCEQVS